jgi:DNA topoisomerase-2
MTKEYNKLSRQLKAEEHILLRPNMYIGSTSLTVFDGYLLPNNVDKKVSLQYVPGLLKLAYEILDNSVDIAIKTGFKFGNKISVVMEDDHCIVEDNGTGIPIQMVQDSNGKDVWNPVLSWCYTMAGTNFDSDDEGRMSMGMNGVGSTVTSIFSKEFVGETHDGSNKLVVKTVDNNKIDKVIVKPSTKRGTKVTFYPDFSRFEVDKFTVQHKSMVKDRIYKLAACYPEISFSFNNEKISMKKMSDIVPMYNEQFLVEKSDNVVVSLYPNNMDDFDFISVVNGLSVIKIGRAHV